MPFNKKFEKLLLLNINKMELQDKIKFIRLSQNLTQGYMADELDIDVANYSRLERGETNISLDRLKKIAEIFDISVTDFLDDANSALNNEVNEKINIYLSEILLELKSINKKLTQ